MRPKISEAPKGSQPIEYDVNERRLPGFESVKEIHTSDNSDALDSATFLSENPFFDAKAEALFQARIPEQKTGVKIEILILQSAAGRIDQGLSKEPEAYPNPWIFLRDEIEFQTLSNFLEHLVKLGHSEVTQIRQKVLDGRALTKEESDVLREYLLYRDKYVEVISPVSASKAKRS